MKTHSTNYTNTFIAAAQDYPGVASKVPAPRKTPTIAAKILEWILKEPYQHTSDDVLFRMFADKQGIPEPERAAAREQYFAKGRACFRANALPKTHGWGVHHDGDSRIALYPMESEAYALLEQGEGPQGPVEVVYAMRSSRKT